jgi:hypothetical protein
MTSSVELYNLAAYLYNTYGISQCAPELQDSAECLAIQIQWTNQYNQIIFDVASNPNSEWRTNNPELNIDPLLLAVLYKRIALNETQFVPGIVTGLERGSGFAQVTPDTLNFLVTKGFIALPEGFNKEDTGALVNLLQDPIFNAQAGMANLVYLYQGVTKSNSANGWQMSEDDVWKLVAALHNTGAQSNSLVVELGSDFDFWEGIRRDNIQNNPDFINQFGCNDPADWDCLKTAIRVYVPVKYQTDLDGSPIPDPVTGQYVLISGGKCSTEYAESVAPDGITSNPASPEVLNAPVRPECKQ